MIKRNNLRNIREQKDCTNVDEIAKKLGISKSYYYKIEQGIRVPNIKLAKKIADELDSSIEELFFDQELDSLELN